MNKRQIEKAWLMCQAVFLAHFTPFVLRAVFRVPRIEIPFLNVASLVGVYAANLYGLPMSEIYGKTEFICILFFISQPPRILLVPFYINSLVNLADFLASRPGRHRRGPVFRAAQFVIARQAGIIDAKILIEILCLPLCIVLIILGYSNMLTLLIYVYLLRIQFESDPAVRRVFLKLRLFLDEHSLSAPPVVRDVYVMMRDYLILISLDNRKSK
eukprot:jgi/Antlo1/2057/643